MWGFDAAGSFSRVREKAGDEGAGPCFDLSPLVAADDGVAHSVQGSFLFTPWATPSSAEPARCEAPQVRRVSPLVPRAAVAGVAGGVNRNRLNAAGHPRGRRARADARLAQPNPHPSLLPHAGEGVELAA